MRYYQFWIACLCLLAVFNPAALALPAWPELQSVLEAPSKTVPVSTLVSEGAQLPLHSLGNLPETITIEQVASMRSSDTRPFNPDITQPMQTGQALWLHFRLTADHPDLATGWLLEFTRPFVDRVELYSQNSQNAWQMQAAGDLIAPRSQRVRMIFISAWPTPRPCILRSACSAPM
jgi:7TMR-DISM extracellular 2